VAFAREGDGAGLPSAFFGLHSIGRLATRTAPRRHGSVCRLSLVRSRAFGHAVAITSVPARDADVMAPALGRDGGSSCQPIVDN